MAASLSMLGRLVFTVCGAWLGTIGLLKIDGDKLKGKGAAEFGGEKQEWDIEGERQKDDK